MLNKYYDEISEAVGKICVYVNKEIIGRFNTYKEAIDFCLAVLTPKEWDYSMRIEEN